MELDCSLLADEGTEGEAAEGTESAEAMEKSSRAVSNPRPQALALCRWGLGVQSWLKDTQPMCCHLYAWVVSAQHKEAGYLRKSTDHFTNNVFPWEQWGLTGLCAPGSGEV